MKKNLDLLFAHATLITMQGEGTGILEDGALGVCGSRIEVVGPSREVLAAYTADRLIEAGARP